MQRIEGREVAARACHALAAGCDQVIAVVRPDSPDALTQILQQQGAQVVVCADADLGMGHSLAAAAHAVLVLHDPVDAVMVMPADMPWMTAETVQSLRLFWSEMPAAERPACIAQPALPDGTPGHPVLFGRDHLSTLCGLSGDAGARALLRRHPPATLVLNDPGILQDIDVPSDLPPS